MNRIALATTLAGWFALASCGNVSCDPGLKTENENAASSTTKNMALPVYFGDGHVKCLTQSLIDQGFNGAFDGFAILEYLGSIQTQGPQYSIYYYDRNENHGTHAIIMMENGCEYFGSYDVGDRPIRVSGADIVFDAPKRIGNVIHFTGISPPARLVINGEPTTFRGAFE